MCALAPLRCGAVAQLGERLVRNEEVSGSIPLSSTKDKPQHLMTGPAPHFWLSARAFVVDWRQNRSCIPEMTLS